MKTDNRRISVISLMLALLVAACSQEPDEINYGSDECQHCKMIISDNRFAAQLVTTKGKAIKFDAIECLAAYTHAQAQNIEGALVWISNFNDPGKWLSAKQAIFIKSEVINSPMGASLLALATMEEADDHVKKYPGQKLTWNDVINM